MDREALQLQSGGHKELEMTEHTHTHTHWVAISPLLFPSTPDNHHSISYIYIYIYTHIAAAAAAKSPQSCPTLCDPRDGSPPGSPAPGILQARTLEWLAISFSNAGKWNVKVKPLRLSISKLHSHVRLLATPLSEVYRLLRAWDFPGKSTGVGYHRLLRELPCDLAIPLLGLFLFILNVVSDSATPWTATCQASLSFLHCLLEFAQIHVHWVSDAI